ncbi:MAG: guanylate kinase, partial [Woeseiales bacterium]
ELERRLRGRQTDSEAVIAQRLADALGDMSHWDEFDYVIINEDLAEAVDRLEAILTGEGERNPASQAMLIEQINNILV